MLSPPTYSLGIDGGLSLCSFQFLPQLRDQFSQLLTHLVLGFHFLPQVIHGPIQVVQEALDEKVKKWSCSNLPEGSAPPACLFTP